MNFYLGQKDNAHKVNIEVAPKITETLDNTWDTATVVLEANTIQNPIAPMTAFYFEISNNETIMMYVQSDTVELFSHSPVRYKHTLQLVQNIRELNKHLVRNSVFTQPAQKQKKSWWSVTQTIRGEGGSAAKVVKDPASSIQGNCETKISLEPREKIKGTPYIIITYQCAMMGKDGDYIDSDQAEDYFENESLSYLNNASQGKVDDIYFVSQNSSPSFHEICYAYYDGGYEIIYLSDISGQEFEFNKPLYVPKLKNILENHTNVYVSTHKMTDSSQRQTYGAPFRNMSTESSINVDLENGSVPAFIMTQMQIVCETYYYDCYNILDLLIKRQQQKSNSGYKEPLFKLDPTSETGLLLKRTVAPNFTFTQCTMYECVAEVFRLFDAIFTMDEDGYLAIDYLNNVQDETQRVYETDFSGETRSITDDRHNGGLISYYQDARTKEVFPGKSNYVRATSKELTVPQQQDHCIITPHKIDNVVSSKLRIEKFHISIFYPASWKPFTVWIDNKYLNLDVTPYIVEESIWTTLSNSQNVPVSNNDYKVVGQVNSVYYQKNNNVIELGFAYKNWIGAQHFAFENMKFCALMRMSGMSSLANSIGVDIPESQTWMNVYMQIEYETSVDGRVRNESIVNKYDGEMLIDQYNGSVDLNKMGLNMAGVSMQLGEPTLNMTHKITNWSQRLRKGSVYIDEDGKRWIANVCTYTILDEDNIQGQISFTCNYNALAMRTKLTRERRMTNISKELTTKSEDNYVDFIYYSTNSSLASQASESVWFGNYFATIINCLFPCNVDNNLFVDTAAVLTSAVPNAVLYIPMIKYSSGNSICFELSYNEPMSAGQKTFTENTSFGGSNQYFTRVIKYTDNYGFFDTANIALGNSNEMKTDEYPYIDLITSKMGISNYEFYKQPNEIFAINMQICFLPVQNRKDIDFLGRGFFDFNFFTNDDFAEKKLYVRYGTGKYNILDTEPIGSDDDRHEIYWYIDTYINADRILIVNEDNFSPDEEDGFTCWCLEDDDGNIYFMSNEVRESSSQQIYFLPRHTRLN